MTGRAPPSLSICAPAYDEAACIEATVRSWLEMIDRAGLDAEVVVADDGSRDETGEILSRLAREDERVRPLRHPTNRGYGEALRSAVARARGEWIVTIDSDGQFDPADVPRLVERQREAGLDLVNGARRKKRDTALRVAADRGLNAAVRALFGTRLRDTNCALKLVRRSWLAHADLRAQGFATPTEMVLVAAHDGLAIGEIDVAHLPRRAGASKLGLARTAVTTFAFLVALRRRLARRV